jgi:hypothetical protein
MLKEEGMMHKIGRQLVLLTSFVLISWSMAFGTQLGPATPSADHGEVNLGIGYFYHEADLDEVDIEQNRTYLHLGYVLGIEEEPRWEVYVRAGAADLEAGGFDGDYEPFASVGLKGAFYEGPVFAWGLVVQGAYFYDYEANDGDIEIEDFWEIEGGIPVQVNLGPLLFYGGPVFFHSEAEAKSNLGFTELKEEDNIGAFGGLRLNLGKNVSIEGEAQYKSDFSAGGLITIHF